MLASRAVEKESPAGISASSSLAALDAAVEAMQMDGNDLLTRIPLDLPDDDLSFSEIVPIPTSALIVSYFAVPLTNVLL